MSVATQTRPSGASRAFFSASVRTRRLALAGTAIASAAMLSGCLVPEKFVAKVEIQPDAGYTFLYSGTAINALAAAQIKQAGSLNSKDEAGLRADADKMVKDHDIRKAAYKGSGRYELEIESQKKPGQPLQMFDIFTVRTEKDGVMTVASNEIKEKGKRELEQLGIVVDGTLEVRVPRNAEVISSNATSTPTLGFGAYSWKIGRIDQRPVLKLRFKPLT